MIFPWLVVCKLRFSIITFLYNDREKVTTDRLFPFHFTIQVACSNHTSTMPCLLSSINANSDIKWAYPTNSYTHTPLRSTLLNYFIKICNTASYLHDRLQSFYQGAPAYPSQQAPLMHGAHIRKPLRVRARTKLIIAIILQKYD